MKAVSPSPVYSEKKWDILECIDPACAEVLVKEVGNLHPLLARILVNRGYSDYDSVKDFFQPKLEKLYDPFLMKDMEKAVKRVTDAISSGQKILIYGDYDVDGTCSVAMMYRFLGSLTKNLAFYIPDRDKEGYGVSEQGIDFAIDNNFHLIISLDCGIKAGTKVARAANNGIDFIICDHHLPPEQLPEAFAILNPKQSDCGYPSKELCGCGVGFKLIQGIVTELGLDPRLALDYLDYVAVATCCDIVPLKNENRIFVAEGLKKLNSSPALGFRAMLEVAKVKSALNVSDVVFKIGPRINAAGRLFSADLAVNLLCNQNWLQALELSRKIDEHNNERKSLDKNMTEHALSMISEDEISENAYTTVVFHKQWHKGVVGIVASRLKETYYRPTIVFTESNGLITGSARSVDGFDVHEALCECEDLIERFGGHQQAAGLSILPENFEAFKSKFESCVRNKLADELRIPCEKVDASVNFTEWLDAKEYANMDLRGSFPLFFKQLKRCAPFGPHNLNPLFCTQNCVASDLRLLGDSHLKFTVFQEQEPDIKLQAIAFKMGHYYDHLLSGGLFDMAYCLSENTWNGTTSLQLEVKDIKPRQR